MRRMNATTRSRSSATTRPKAKFVRSTRHRKTGARGGCDGDDGGGGDDEGDDEGDDGPSGATKAAATLSRLQRPDAATSDATR